MRAEYNRFALRSDSDGELTDSDGAAGARERGRESCDSRATTPGLLYITTTDGLVREPFADLESALMAQGGRLVDPKHILH